MAYRGQKLLVCPQCSKKGVSMRFAAVGEDHYGCRYCIWFAFISGNDQTDIEQREALAKANPDTEGLT